MSLSSTSQSTSTTTSSRETSSDLTTSTLTSTLISTSISDSSSSLPTVTPSSSARPTTRALLTDQSLTESCSTTSQAISSTTSSRTSTSQSSVSQISSTALPTLNASATSSSASTNTLTPLPTTRQYHTFIREESTSLVKISSYQIPFTSRALNALSFQIIEPTATATEPEPIPTAIPATSGRTTHRLIIDLGDCAGFTSPRLILSEGELGDLVAIGTGRFAIEMRTGSSSGVFGLTLSLKDDGVRCGSADPGSCTAIELTFGLTSGVSAYVLRGGDYDINMYPFSMWLEDGVTWGAQLANSPEEMYHCWGWSMEECPYVSGISSDAGWATSSENPAGSVYVGFCPSDGPDWSTIPPNPDPTMIDPTWAGTAIILPTQTVVSVSSFLTVITPTKLSSSTSAEPTCGVLSTCISPNTYISGDAVSTIWTELTIPPTGPTGIFSTAIVLHTTSTVTKTVFLAKPTSTVTSSMVEVTHVDPAPQSESTSSTSTRRRTRRPGATTSRWSGTPVPTSTPTVVPTDSDTTNSPESATSTLSYDPTISPTPTTTPAPDSQYVRTSWTTWMTINGTTVPAIAGQVGVLSTIPITYMLEPSTTIPVVELSSRSVESVRTSSPSPTTAASNENQTSQDQGGRIAGAVVGTLVGLVLGSLVLWYIFYRRRQRQRLDHFARGDPAWLSPRHENGSGGSRLLVDLDEEPRMRNSYVEPWVPPRPAVQPPLRGKASQPEMENVPGGYGVSTMAGPSREAETSSNEGGASWFQPESSDNHLIPAAAATRPGKPATRNEPTRRPDLVSQRPIPSHYQTPSLANPSLSLLPTPFQNEPPSPITPVTPPSRAALMPSRVSPPPRAGPSQRRYLDDEEQVRHNAIPPLYNEAWNTGR
ncbi:unnamed protein product [Rhizoctonia solani]|uniref:Transmembrane protein n=1 Tax=Rhizoctonia solani TaxID=456999 RepID=A0A8H3E9E9_9AGAM|nr:unnamed protein product [Rhizoctonia solani]